MSEFPYGKYHRYPLVQQLRHQTQDMDAATFRIYLRETFSSVEELLTPLVEKQVSTPHRQKKVFRTVMQKILTYPSQGDTREISGRTLLDQVIREAAQVEDQTEVTEALETLVKSLTAKPRPSWEFVRHVKTIQRKQMVGLTFVGALGLMGAVTGANGTSFPQAGARDQEEKVEVETAPKRHILPLEMSLLEESELTFDTPLHYDELLSIAESIKQRHQSARYPKEEYSQTIAFLLGDLASTDAQKRFLLRKERDGYVRVQLEQEQPLGESRPTDILIIGAEIESLTTAMHAATAGHQVTLLYSGPLGGIASDKGANMRYFDHMSEAVTFKQKELFQKVFRMEAKNAWAIPKGIDVRIERYFFRHYPSIRLIKTDSYRTIEVGMQEGKIAFVRTAEGQEIAPRSVIDTSPSGSVASQTSIPRTLDTPHLGYGLVFDITGIAQKDFTHLYVDAKPLDLEAIMMFAGVTSDMVKGAGHLAAKIQRYQQLSNSRDIAHAGPYVSFGFKRIGYAYDLYMHFLALHDGDHQLHQLNQDRIPDGLNIAFRGQTATCNSLSYRTFQGSMRPQFQNEHNLHTDEQFTSLRDREIPALEEFLQKLFSNPSIEVHLPEQLYVRKAHVAYQTLHKPELTDFQYDGAGLAAKYPNDVRSMTPRYQGDTLQHSIAEIQAKVRELRWKIDPRSAMTEVPNLYLLSKSAFPPLYSGAMRIQQNLIGLGYMTVEHITNPTVPVPPQGKQEGYKRPGPEMLESYLGQ